MKKKIIKISIFSFLLIGLFFGLCFIIKSFFPDLFECTCPAMIGAACPCAGREAATVRSKSPVLISKDDKPTVGFFCGDFGFAIYKTKDNSDFLLVQDCAWASGWHCSDYRLQKTNSDKLFKETIQVRKRWDNVQNKWEYENIPSAGWILYTSENTKSVVWNNGKKWILQNNRCEGMREEG